MLKWWNPCRRFLRQWYSQHGVFCKPACGGDHSRAAHVLLHGETPDRTGAFSGFIQHQQWPGDPRHQLERRRQLHRGCGRPGGQDHRGVSFHVQPLLCHHHMLHWDLKGRIIIKRRILQQLGCTYSTVRITHLIWQFSVDHSMFARNK